MQRRHPRANLNWVRVSASDFSADPNGTDSAPARYARNLSFRNDIIELGLGAEIDLLKNTGSSNRRVPFTPYLFVGIGGFYHNPQGKIPTFDTHNPDYNVNDPVSSPESVRFDGGGERWVSLKQFGTEGQNIAGTGVTPYSNFQVNIPVAIGFRLRLPENFDASFEFGVRYIFFDYLDDVSGTFIGIERFDDPLARAFVDRSIEHIDVVSGDPRDLDRVREVAGGFSLVDGVRRRASFGSEGDIRGNPDDNDLYFVTQLKLSYILNGTRTTAKFR